MGVDPAGGVGGTAFKFALFWPELEAELERLAAGTEFMEDLPPVAPG